MFRVRESAVLEPLDEFAPSSPEPVEADSVVANLKEFAPSMDLISGRPMGSIFAEDLTIEGDIVSHGPLEIYGNVKGNIDAAFVTVAESGTIKGDLKGRNLTVHGSVRGDLHGAEVDLAATARVRGDIYHGSIAMARGAQFNGKAAIEERSAERSDPERSLVARLQTAVAA